MHIRPSKFSKSPVRQGAAEASSSASSTVTAPAIGSSVPAQAGGAPADAAGFFAQMKSFFTGDKGSQSQKPAAPVGLDQFAHFGNNNASPSQPANPNGVQNSATPPNGNPPATGSQSGQPTGSIDPAQLMAAVGNMNFAQAIPPELMTKALAGEADSPQALLHIINSTAQNAFAQSTLLTNNLVNQRLEAMQAKIDAGLGDKVTNLQRKDAVASNPMLQHPALAPIKNALTAQFTTQYANESPQAIQQKVSEYMTSMASFLQSQMAPTKDQQQNNKLAAWQKDAMDF